ncbi:hypothetical protein IMZ48_40930 [Candidatus Bathyarchaeota archaeon]|nr:hypothetical protein [Candidatus Bathyarchaeota archaeon]
MFQVGSERGSVRRVELGQHKCGRCWRYLAEKEDSVCGRCEDAVKDL